VNAPAARTSPVSDPVLLSVQDGIARLRLNRPQASNGLDVELLQALHAALMRCRGDALLRVLLLGGEGPNFCAGGDVKDFAAKGEGLPDYLREATAWLSICTQALISLPAPVVTLVQGFAAGGGGIGLVCASDIVIAAESARFLSAATRVGMAPDGGSSVTLARLVGQRRALQFTLLNPTWSAAQALAAGLVTEVVPDEALGARGDALAHELASGPTQALAETKRLLWDGVGRSVEQALGDESRTVARLAGTHDALEGLAAVIERRAPRYEGR
jgi:2-(1,2-epoxy-1,2-dihydrophenyl)acetyl-CoA isomerase